MSHDNWRLYPDGEAQKLIAVDVTAAYETPEYRAKIKAEDDFVTDFLSDPDRGEKRKRVVHLLTSMRSMDGYSVINHKEAVFLCAAIEALNE